MVDILRIPDMITIFCDEENKDAKVSFELEGRKLKMIVLRKLRKVKEYPHKKIKKILSEQNEIQQRE